MNGVVLIDKPPGLTSHDVVNRWRRLAGTRRVGHLGTLDPMATGLLALVTGSATRLAQYLEREQKTYQAVITLGRVSDTYDAEGEVVETNRPLPDEAEVCQALNRFRGRFLQTPPPVSAKKVRGVPAYKLARQKIALELKPIEIEVTCLELHIFECSRVEMTISCTAGTYIRSIAHELGQVLGCGALLSALRRTRIGPFELQGARTIGELETLAQAGTLASAVLPASKLLPTIPAEFFDVQAEAQIRQGRDFRTSPFVVPPGAPRVRALSRDGELVAIGELVIPNLYHPVTVLPAESVVEPAHTTKPKT